MDIEIAAMTVYEFGRLSESKQISCINKKAVYLSQRRKGDYVIILYQLDSFYVEICHHKNVFECKKIVPFTTTDLLSPYLESIDISGIYN